MTERKSEAGGKQERALLATRGEVLLMAPGSAPDVYAELEPTEAHPRQELPFTYGLVQDALCHGTGDLKVGTQAIRGGLTDTVGDTDELSWEYDEVAQRNVISDDRDAIWMAVEWGGGTCAATASRDLPDLDVLD